MVLELIIYFAVLVTGLKVSFELQDVTVTHWQHLIARKISITKTTSFLEFCRKVKSSFSEEITTEMFRIYQLPHGFTSVQERSRISSDDELHDYFAQLDDPFSFHPVLYVWNHEDDSPKR